MPTIWRQDGFRFFFFSNEHEPLHVHVEKGGSVAKFYLIPVSLVKNEGMSQKDIHKALVIILKKRDDFISEWRTRFNGASDMDTVTLLKSLKVTSVWFDTEKVYFDLTDGKTIGSPLNWFPRLKNASDSQRQNWRLIAGGYGVHWEEIDEDLSAEGMLLYNPQRKP